MDVHFYDARLHHQHPLADLLSDPLLPGQRRLVGALLLGRLLLGLPLCSKETHMQNVTLCYPWLIVYTAWLYRLKNKGLEQTDSR